MMIASYAYVYTIDGGAAIAIDGDAEQVEFTVPEGVNYGAELEFTVTVTDMVNLTHESSVTKLVFDSDITEIIITTVGGVPYVPGLHINGEAVGFDILLLGNEEPDLITDVALKYRYVGDVDWTLCDEDAPVLPVTGDNNDEAYGTWDVSELDEGDVEVGAVPVSDPENIWEEPLLYWATMYIDHTAPELGIPDYVIPSCINDGIMIRVEFAELPADLDHTLVRFEYVIADQADIPEAWTTWTIPPFFGYDSGFWFFEFNPGEEECPFINSEVYDFRLHIADVAVPDPNTTKVDEIEEVDGGTLFDDEAPIVFVSQIDEYVAPFTPPVEVVLSTSPTFTALAFEHPEQYPFVCGVESVEFYIDGELIDVVFEEPYMTNAWNTTGLMVGTYTLSVTACDFAGNCAEDSVDLMLVPYMEPYAVIVGFDFDFEVENWDKIYAVSRDCQDRPTEEVHFQFYVGYEWITFAIAQTPMNESENGMDLWMVEFNADNMITTTLRAVAYYNNALDELTESSIKPELAVQYLYTPEQGGIFDLVEGTTNEDVRFYYRDLVRATIQQGERVPFFFGMNEVNDNNVQSTEVELFTPHQLADDELTFEALTCETNLLNFMDDEFGNVLTLWSASVDPMNGYSINLNRAIIDVHPITGQGSFGTMTSEDGVMDITVPANGGGTGWIYFEPVLEEDEISYDWDMIPIARQEVVRGDIGQAHAESDFNMYFVEGFRDIDPDAPVYMIWSHGQGGGGYRDTWEFEWDEILEAEFIFEGETPIGASWSWDLEKGFYTLIQLVDPGYEVEFVAVDNQYTDPMDLMWSSFAPTGYGLAGWLQEMILPGWDDIDFYFRTFMFYNSETGEYEVDDDVDIDVYLDDIRIVDDNEADPTWVGHDLVVDPVSGMFEIELLDDNEEYFFDDPPGEVHTITVFIYQNGFETATTSQEFAIDHTPPHVDNLTGGGYIRHNVTLAVDITDPETQINSESIQVALINPEVLELELFIPIIVDVGSMDVTEIENGYHCEYTLTLDDLGMIMNQGSEPWNDVNEVMVIWSAMDNVEIYNWMDLGFNPAVYIVDVAPPQVWAISPIGSPIDNDGDGLFNEDPINGINEDQDFDDWNNNGIQDGYWDWWDDYGTCYWTWIGEPSIVDEDPFDYGPDTLLYGTEIVVAIGYEDIPGATVVDPWYTWWSGACGVDTENILVTLNGEILPNEDAIITEGVWQYGFNRELLTPGHYVVIGSVPDMVGNVGSVNWEFEVLGAAPTVTFIEPEAGWWLTTHTDNTLEFTVETLEGCPVAFDGVVAYVWQEPSNMIIQGPMTLSPDPYGVYSVIINTGIVFEDETAVSLQVFAATIWGDESESWQSYGIDNTDPTIEIVSPEDGEHFELHEAVHIIATYDDVQYEPERDGNSPDENALSIKIGDISTRENGSGIDYAEVVITDPLGGMETYTGGDNYVEHVILAGELIAGTYVVTVNVEDMVGNVGVETIDFIVDCPAPTVQFIEPEAGWWLTTYIDNTLEFTIETHEQGPLAFDGVVAYVWQEPSHVVVQGPMTLSPDEYGVYSVHINAGVIGVDESFAVLQVFATTIWDDTSESNQAYAIDNADPTIEFLSPDDEEIFGLNEAVHILATYEDVQSEPERDDATINIGDSSTRDNGCGIDHAELIIIDPTGASETYAGGDGFVEHNILAGELIAGTYVLTVNATDMVGNIGVASIEFYVDAPSPTVTFHPFNGSWWFNPAYNTVPFTFEVHSTGEVPIAEDGVVVTFYGVLPGEDILLQGPQTLAYSESGLYEICLGANVPSSCTGIILGVEVTNVYGVFVECFQTYGIDDEAPIITFVSPEYGEYFSLEAIVNVLATFTDTQEGGRASVRTYGSGILSANLKVEDPLGNIVVEVDEGEDVQQIGAAVTDLIIGTYTVTVTVTDKACNTAIATLPFYVNADAVGITFNELGPAGWWYGPQMNVPFTFNIAGDIAQNGVIVNFYGAPGAVLLQGPQNVYGSQGYYSVWLAADVGDYSAVILEVEATNISGQVTYGNQTYGLDLQAPVITIESPSDGDKFTAADLVDIRAYYSDSQSGVNTYVLKVDGVIIPDSCMTSVSESSLLYSDNYPLGEHTIQLIVTDFVMNINSVTWCFLVLDKDLELTFVEVHVYPNPMDTEAGATFVIDVSKTADIEIKIYDFAGKEVCTLVGSDRSVITWDGCTNKGTKLGRGVYFARVSANDGKSVVEKIIKIAIK